MVVSLFPIGQAASCETMRVIWRNCKSNIGPMRDLKSVYTIELCTQRIAEIDLADALPDDAARAMVHKAIRLEVLEQIKNCTKSWKRLKLYINGVFVGEEARTVQYIGAGWNHYEGAAAQNLQDVNDLMQSGINYITANETALRGAEDKNMPESFPETFQLAWDLYKEKRQKFIDALNDSKVATAFKVTCINDCYIAAINMGTDGQEVFENDEEMRRLFSFEAMSAVVSPPGPASFEITVEVDGVAKRGAEVFIEGTDKSGVTDAEGKVLFLQMQDGNMTCKIICDGYAQQLVTETLEAGVRKRVTATLQPLFEGALKVGSEQGEVGSQKLEIGN
ncbi:MAG: hypothetical protein ABI855_07170 [Bacteroidota bacterium]